MSLSPSDESRFVDGGVSHNNPASIALREASDLYGCPTEDILMTSVGCGQLNLVPRSDDIVGQIIHSIYLKTSPAQEEEDRSVWGHREKYTRLDPQIDIKSFPLDDIKSIEIFRLELDKAIWDSRTLREQIADAAWKLVANTFFCLPDSVSRQVTIHNRLGLEVEKIIEKYKDLELVVIHNGAVQSCCKVDHSSFPVRIQSPEGANVDDIKLCSNDRTASISGFGFPKSRMMASLNRKRKFEHAN